MLLDNLLDQKSQCHSIMVEIKVSDYLKLIEKSYNNQGQLKGQREKLKTTSGTRIRARMTEDFKKNAILPPVVLGLVVSEKDFANVGGFTKKEELSEFLSQYDESEISIIDGMQRTTVYLETADITKDYIIRCEFWVTAKTESLTYRMLVLNTGQVPWNLRRQVEVVYEPLLKEIENRIYEFHPELRDQLNLYAIDDKGARTKAAEFHKNQIVELYLSFGLRKEKIDTGNILAEDFSRLDMIEAMSQKDFFNDFIKVFAMLCKLDISISNNLVKPLTEYDKIAIGRHLFDSMPAKVGFIVSASQTIYGRLGTKKSDEEQEKTVANIIARVESLIKRIDDVAVENQEEFYSFSILNEQIKHAPTNRIGDWQRSFYLESFRLLLNETFSDSLEPCWRAY